MKGIGQGSDSTGSLSALFRDCAEPVPLSGRQERAQGLHRAARRQRGRAERGAGQDRVPPQPDRGLSTQLSRLPGLRLGSSGGGRFPGLCFAEEAAQAARRPCVHGVPPMGDGRTIRTSPALSHRAPPRRRHDADGRKRFCGHGGTFPCLQLRNRVQGSWGRVAAGPFGRRLPDGFPGRRAVDDLQLLRP